MPVALIIVAFLFGFVATRMGLPALVGYLAAGFVLFAAGYESTEAIEVIAEVGVLLLLFGIGLKLKIGFLARREVWATATVEVAVVSIVFAGVILGIGTIGLPMVADLDTGQALMLGFVFSFSSTVFAIKILEQTNESGSLSGRLAIGVLIIQDIFAVGFLVFLAQSAPSWLAIPMVVALVALRPVFGWFVSHSGHGELLVLLGLVLAVGVGAGGFHLVGLEPELGALFAGIVVSSHPRAGEMADRLLDFKDLFLVGFFLSIGLGGMPPAGALVLAAVMLVLLPIKSGLFLVLFTRFHLRTRTAVQTSLTLSSYSEFGLIVAVMGQTAGYLDQEWVSTIAIVVAGSFAVAAVANTARHRLPGNLSSKFAWLERPPIIPDDEVADLVGAKVIVLGMGRVGVGAYDALVARYGEVVIGVERSTGVIADNTDAGRSVVLGNALDREFWEQLESHDEIELILVALDNHASNLVCVLLSREFLPNTHIAAIARYPDQVDELNAVGVDVARNLYEEAGQGLADDAVGVLDDAPASALEPGDDPE